MERAATKTAGTKSRKPGAAGKRPAIAEAKFDLDGLGREELLQLQKDVDRALRTYEKRKRDEALREMQAVAETHGLSLKDLMGAKRSGRTPQVPKYQHAENPALTWSGRGRQPAWFKEAVDAGVSRKDLLIA